MPRYDTQCTVCEFVKEITKGMMEDPPPCVECGEPTKIVILSAMPSVQFKGGGWGGEDCKRNKGKVQ